VNLVSATTTAGRTAALVRVDSNERFGPGLEESEPTFDELAIGYLATSHARATEVSA
jgi:ABC-2 type transport system ATP-binding protein